ncbi:MAG: hypothetical protein FWF46_09150, partial [Oscillospiraceae bacterium]|nr:hypothetical protein [Oscillospiraceae bacterium]
AQVGVGKNATYYNSLQAAIDAVPATNVATPVILLKDTTESVLIAENKNVNLDLNGKTLTAGTVSTDAIALINKAGYNTEGVSNFVMALINSRNVYNNRWNNRSSNFKHRFGLRLVFGYVQLSVYVR